MEMEMTLGIDVLLVDFRRCPLHGEVLTSADGIYDAPCGRCEAEMDIEAEKRAYEEAAGTPYGLALVQEDDVSAWLRPHSLHPLLTFEEVEADIARDREILF